MSGRRIRRQFPALREDIGDLLTRRPLPGPGIDQLDPFLFLNHHGPQRYAPDNRGLPFGPHPHRGFETVTFILAGELAHRDSGGHDHVIGPGGVQWMTAGSGLVHAELSPESFKRSGGPLEIVQLWVNLPARLKMTPPAYQGFQRDGIPTVTDDAGRITVQVIAGEWTGTRGAVESVTGVTMMTVAFDADGTTTLPAPRGHTVFFYGVRGELSVAGVAAKPQHLVEMTDEGTEIVVSAAGAAFLLFGHALPYNEPMVSHGPFVMNTRAEIRTAIEDYQAGKFGSVHV